MPYTFFQCTPTEKAQLPSLDIHVSCDCGSSLFLKAKPETSPSTDSKYENPERNVLFYKPAARGSSFSALSFILQKLHFIRRA